VRKRARGRERERERERKKEGDDECIYTKNFFVYKHVFVDIKISIHK